MKTSSELSYFIERPSGVSLDPLQSDSLANAILMKHFVGTLVRYANGGQFEPYLAETFKSSEDGKIWSFKFREGLTTQDNAQMTAAGYIGGLERVLRMYAKQGALPIFSSLKGWNNFVLGEKLSGLQASAANEVIFEFENRPGSGFLEYLCMPYYGYFADANFRNEAWKSKDSIVSSGPYELVESISARRPIKLVFREHWRLSPKSAPKKVTYYTKISDQAWHMENTIIQTALPWDQATPKGFRRIWGPPDLIRATILNDVGPTRFFAKPAARKQFQSKFLELKKLKQLRSNQSTPAESFYAGSELVEDRRNSDQKVAEAPATPLLVFVPTTNDHDIRYGVDLTLSVLESLRWKHKVLTTADLNGALASGAYRKKHFDISVVGVIAGNVIEPWTVDMMFCSNMGVSFPDPSGTVCRFVKELLAGKQDFNIQEKSKALSQIVQDDAAVNPISHGRTTWYFSQDIDVSNISGDLIVPSFEDLAIDGGSR